MNRASSSDQLLGKSACRWIAGFASCLVITLPVHAQDSIPAEGSARQIADVDIGGVSPDGRLYTFTDWTTGNLVLGNFETRERTNLTQDGYASGFAQALQFFSPDGRWVAYGWQRTDGCDLRVVDVETGDTRVLYRDADVSDLWPTDWARDGRSILAFVAMKDGTDRLATVDSTDGTVRVLKTIGAEDPRVGTIFAFSPDGRFVTYDAISDSESLQRDVHVLAVEDGSDTLLIEHAANDYVLGWEPEGSRVIFASDRSGTLDAWAIEVEDGNPRGRSTRLRSEIPSTDWGMFAEDGSYYYARLSRPPAALYVTNIDSTTGRAQPPEELAPRVAANTSAEWSYDGRALVFVTGAGDLLMDPYVLWIRSLETGEERRLRIALDRFGGHAFQPKWSPGGDAFLGSSQQGLQRIDARTGALTVEVEAPCPGTVECVEWPVWASEVQ